MLKENTIDSVLLLNLPDKKQGGYIVEAMKPGAHLLLLNPIKEHHLHTIHVEDAGLEVRDTIAYVFSDDEKDTGMMLVTVTRKPLEGTVAENTLKYGTGGLNIDSCRVEHVTVDGGNLALNPHLRSHINGGNGGHIISTETERRVVKPHSEGRWPANLILHDCPTVRAMFPFTKSGKDVNPTSNSVKGFFSQSMSYYSKEANYGDSGSAARFFYSAPCLNDLCSYLIRLITPPGGTVLTSYGFPVATDDFHLIEYREGYSLGRSI